MFLKNGSLFLFTLISCFSINAFFSGGYSGRSGGFHFGAGVPFYPGYAAVYPYYYYNSYEPVRYYNSYPAYEYVSDDYDDFDYY